MVVVIRIPAPSTLRTLPVATLFCALWTTGPAAAVESAWGATAYVRVLDPDGAPARSLSVADFKVYSEGVRAELVEARLVERGEPGSELRLAIHIGEDLDVREAFRSQRAVLDLAPRLDLGKDSAAVYSRYALSEFTRDRGKLLQMIRYFGEEIDRMGFGRAAPATSPWKTRWPAEAPKPEQAGADLEQLLRRGNQGRLTSVLTPLRGLEGRKILLYFGRDVPYQSQELEYHDPSFGARALSDAGFSVFAFNPSGREDSGMKRIREWAEATGGAARSLAGDLRPALREWLRDLFPVYLLQFRDRETLDGRWRDLRIDAADPGLRAFHPAGFFSTLDATADLTQRTLWTVAIRPEAFRDFAVGLEVELVMATLNPMAGPTPSAAKIVLRFPVAARDQDREALPSRGGDFQQRVQFFVGVYDRRGGLLGRFEAPGWLSPKPSDLEESRREWARLDETILFDRLEDPGSVQAIVVIGQNRRIGFQSLVFPGPTPRSSGPP